MMAMLIYSIKTAFKYSYYLSFCLEPAGLYLSPETSGETLVFDYKFSVRKNFKIKKYH